MAVSTDDSSKLGNVEAGKKQIASTTDSEDALDSPAGEKTDATPQSRVPAGSDAPDGGAAAWLCVLGAWCTAFCSFGWINSASRV